VISLAWSAALQILFVLEKERKKLTIDLPIQSWQNLNKLN
jgi:hypothetical protein